MLCSEIKAIKALYKMKNKLVQTVWIKEQAVIISLLCDFYALWRCHILCCADVGRLRGFVTIIFQKFGYISQAYIRSCIRCGHWTEMFMGHYYFGYSCSKYDTLADCFVVF